MKIKTMVMEKNRGEARNTKIGKFYPLLYLKKALREEAYEECAYWVRLALRSGVTHREVDRVLRERIMPLEELCCY